MRQASPKRTGYFFDQAVEIRLFIFGVIKEIIAEFSLPGFDKERGEMILLYFSTFKK